MSHQAQFNPQKIFATLFVLTAVEVGWGLSVPYSNKLLLWGGLLAFAFWKGLLIFMYFMHMKFEGWIVKGLIAPTPFLIAVVVFALWPDVASNDQLIYRLTDQFDPQQGKVVEIGHGTEDPREHGKKEIGPDGQLRDAVEHASTEH
jgi:cytochrome c oxidase subunit IV